MQSNIRTIRIYLAQLQDLGWDFLLNRRMHLTKLVAPFLQIARVGPARSSIHDFFGLNTEPMNRVVGGSHLYSVRHAEKAIRMLCLGKKSTANRMAEEKLAANLIS